MPVDDQVTPLTGLDGSDPVAFSTTHWSVVLEAQGESATGKEALEKCVTRIGDLGMVRWCAAIISAWAGGRELALEHLMVVARIPGGPSYGDLRLSPMWNPLRGNPRFEKIVASLAPK